MKISTFMHILLICSLVMLIPAIEKTYSLTLFPETEKSFVIVVQTPQIIISSDKPIPIEVTVSYLSLLDEESKTITQEFFRFISSTQIDTDKPGSYLLEFYSEETSEVTIQTSGIYINSIVIILTLLVIDLSISARNYFLVLDT